MNRLGTETSLPKRMTMTLRFGLMAVFGLSLAAPMWSAGFFFSTGNPDGKLGALTRRSSPGKLETETADDFALEQTTAIRQAVITGIIIPSGTALANISQVEVELYHVFPLDSDTSRTITVPTRVNSPGDVEIASATRDSFANTLSFSSTLRAANFTVANSVVNGINKKPGQSTLGEGAKTGEEVVITISFTTPIILPAGHYFFRPEVLVTGGDFLYLSAPGRSSRPERHSRWTSRTCKPGSATRRWLRIGFASAPTSSMAPLRPRSI
jgi:hypothetical protein